VCFKNTVSTACHKVENSIKAIVSRRSLVHNLAQPMNIRFDLHHDVISVTVQQQYGCLCVLEVPGSTLRPYVLRFPSFHPDVGMYLKISNGGYIPFFLIAAIHKAENRLKVNMVFKRH
jgi:hypothetical protein